MKPFSMWKTRAAKYSSSQSNLANVQMVSL